MKKSLIKLFGILYFLTVILLSCSSNGEPEDVSSESNVSIRFRYEMNMLNVNEFTKEVKSVAVWIFDKEGKLAWSKIENANESFSNDFSLKADLKPGEYDILAWCGKTSDLSLLPKINAASLSELSISLSLFA